MSTEALTELVEKFSQITPLAAKVAELKGSIIEQEAEALTASLGEGSSLGKVTGDDRDENK